MSNLLSLFWGFFKIGFFTFGGGLAMIPFIVEEFVGRLKWLTHNEMEELVVLAQTLPGVVAVNTSILVGQRKAGWVGAIVAALGTILPAFLSIILILVVLTGFEQNPYVKAAFLGFKGASAALILSTVWHMARNHIHGSAQWVVGALGLLMVIVGISAGWVIVFGALAGIIITVMAKKSISNP